MNSPEFETNETKESLIGRPDERTGTILAGVLSVGLAVNLSFALMYINTLPEVQQPTPDKVAQIHSQKP